jgi:hypothetical protein
MASIGIDRLIRYFVYATIINAFAAVAFTVPVIIPQLAFPLKLEVWPGTWMFFSYFVFLIVGVLGTLGWAVLFDMVRRVTGTQSCDRFLAVSSLALTELAVYVEASFMFTAGYIGGSYAFGSTVGSSVITYIIGPLVIPIGVSIFIYLVGMLLGLMNVVLLFGEGRGPPPSAVQTPRL